MSSRKSFAKGAVAGALVAGAVGLGVAPAEAGTLYRWETAEGTLAFADDPKRIPERYRDVAEQIQVDGLEGYARFTPIDGAAEQARTEQLAERLDGLREAAGAEDAAEAAEAEGAAHPIAGVALRSVRETTGRRLVNTPDGPRWRRTTRLQTVDQPAPVLGVAPDPDSDEPVVVERVRARSRDSLVSRHVTVVRQGDRVLAVLKPRSHQADPDVVLEEDLER
jgi:hypothetical protein